MRFFHRTDATSVTTASEGLSTEMRGRQTKYLAMMAVRILCLPLVIMFDGWLRWALIASAVILPYAAVLIANAARRDSSQGPQPVELPHMYALPPAHSDEHRINSA